MSSSVLWNGEKYPIEWQEVSEGKWSAENAAGRFELTLERDGEAIVLRPAMHLSGNVEEFSLRILEFPELHPDHLTCGGQRMGRGKLFQLPAEEATTFVAYYTCVLTKDGQNVLLSTPLEQTYQNRFAGSVEGTTLSQFVHEYMEHNNALRDVQLDPIRVEAGNAFELLNAYGERSVKVKRDFQQPLYYGWNSWDYYRWTITEDEVLRNARFIANDPVLRKHIRRIIVDDGWQYCYGEWDANPYFPHGMKWLAEQITALGFEPGLWFAPAIIEPHARIAQLDYDMLARSEGGQPCLIYECMRRVGFVLDPTVPKTRKWLTELFDRYAGMGYKYFKLDFLGIDAEAPRYSDPTVPRVDLLRLLLSAVQEGVAGRSVLLGCNYPYSNGNGFVEAVRVGADIHALWKAIKRNTASVATMFWANKRLWLNDPDFAVVRSLETSDDPEMMRLKPLYPFVTPEATFIPDQEMALGGDHVWEMEVLLAIDIMAAGAINLSDNLPRLNERGLQMLRKVVSAASGETGIPLDLFSSQLPAYWLQKVGNAQRLLVINWTDQAQEFPLDWKAYGGKPDSVRNFWTDQIMPATLSVSLEPHHSWFVEF
ncbi:MAG: alpha-galactosidase [Victivallales bacterium]|nr:alpha-galactosidase [Victivallales bacterium]